MMRPLEVHLAPAYRMLMWILGFFTFGVGAFGLWLTARKWPRRLDDSGITLRNGKLFAWSALTDIIRVTVVRHEGGGRMTGRLDLQFGRYRVSIVPQSLVEGPAVMAWLSEKLGQELTTG